MGRTASLDLAMPRHDIADYLGLTLETVSRMFAELKEKGVIGSNRRAACTSWIRPG